jgi:hypothetical protein
MLASGADIAIVSKLLGLRTLRSPLTFTDI